MAVQCATSEQIHQFCCSPVLQGVCHVPACEEAHSESSLRAALAQGPDFPQLVPGCSPRNLHDGFYWHDILKQDRLQEALPLGCLACQGCSNEALDFQYYQEDYCNLTFTGRRQLLYSPKAAEDPKKVCPHTAEGPDDVHWTVAEVVQACISVDGHVVTKKASEVEA
eukprot:900951-Rhodomonas_salina.1